MQLLGDLVGLARSRALGRLLVRRDAGRAADRGGSRCPAPGRDRRVRRLQGERVGGPCRRGARQDRIGHGAGRGVRLKSGIKLKRLDTALKGIHIDRTRRKVTRIDEAQFTASVTGADLNSFLAKQYPDIPGLAELRDGYVRVEARPHIGGKRVTVEADAALEIEGDTRLVLRVRRVVSGRVAAPELAERHIEKRLNPVLDLAALGFRGKLTSVVVSPDAVTLSGRGEPDALAKL